MHSSAPEEILQLRGLGPPTDVKDVLYQEGDARLAEGLAALEAGLLLWPLAFIRPVCDLWPSVSLTRLARRPSLVCLQLAPRP